MKFFETTIGPFSSLSPSQLSYLTRLKEVYQKEHPEFAHYDDRMWLGFVAEIGMMVLTQEQSVLPHFHHEEVTP